MRKIRKGPKLLTPTFWNGEPCEARIVNVIVGKPLKPTWWCAEFEGKKRKAVQVAQHGQTFFMDNEDGSGWRKVTEGKGMPNYPHSSLPDDSQIVAIYVPTLSVGKMMAWFFDSPDTGLPECICSYCELVIRGEDEDPVPIRLFDNESKMEARFHPACWLEIQPRPKDIA